MYSRYIPHLLSFTTHSSSQSSRISVTEMEIIYVREGLYPVPKFGKTTSTSPESYAIDYRLFKFILIIGSEKNKRYNYFELMQLIN
jgi:hypothetical protein